MNDLLTTHNFFKTKTKCTSSNIHTSYNNTEKMAAFEQKWEGEQDWQQDLLTTNFSDSVNPHLLHQLDRGQKWNKMNETRKWGFSWGESNELQWKTKNFRAIGRRSTYNCYATWLFLQHKVINIHSSYEHKNLHSRASFKNMAYVEFKKKKILSLPCQVASEVVKNWLLIYHFRFIYTASCYLS